MFPKRVSGHCNSAPLSSPVIEDIFYFSRPLMLVIPACLLALDRAAAVELRFRAMKERQKSIRELQRTKTQWRSRRIKRLAASFLVIAFCCSMASGLPQQPCKPTTSAVKWGRWSPLQEGARMVSSLCPLSFTLSYPVAIGPALNCTSSMLA